MKNICKFVFFCLLLVLLIVLFNSEKVVLLLPLSLLLLFIPSSMCFFKEIPSLFKIAKNTYNENKIDFFAWLTANVIISFLTSYWFPLFWGETIIHKELLMIAFVIFVNAYLFSIIPNFRNIFGEEPELNENLPYDDCLAPAIKSFNILSIVISISIPFLLSKTTTSKIYFVLASIILIILSLMHFLYQLYCKDSNKYTPREASSKLTQDDLRSTIGGRKA